MACWAKDSSELNSDLCTTLTSCNDHLYWKATSNFDEGSSAGLLVQNALVSDGGRRLLVHSQHRTFSYQKQETSLEDMDLLNGHF